MASRVTLNSSNSLGYFNRWISIQIWSKKD